MLKKTYSVFEKYFLFFLSTKSKLVVRNYLASIYNKTVNYCYDHFFVYLKSWIYLLKNPRSYRNIFISCIPKSGSTYTQRVLEKGLPGCFKYYRIPRIHYNLSGKGISRLKIRCSITRIHMHATELNINCLKNNGINKYIVMLRDPRDVLISFYHQVEKEGFSAGFVHLTREYFLLDRNDKIQYLIKYLLPRCIDYINSWDSPDKKLGDLEILKLYYRDMISDPDNHFQKILNFYNIPLSCFDNSFINIKKGVRFRKGKIGNWKEYFTEEQKNLVNTICGDVLKKHLWD